MATKKANKEATFEQDLDRIEKLVTDMQEKDIEQTVDLYAEAMQLIIKCKKKLDGFKAKLQMIEGEDVKEIKNDDTESDE